MRLKKLFVMLLITIFLVSVLLETVSAIPFGANVGTATTSRKIADTPGSYSGAYAGNISGFNLNSESITNTWQGYYGNVTGTITLDDASNYTMYNWSLQSPSGEVYSANQSINWQNIQCFNFTANGTLANNVDNTDAIAGATSLTGWNMTHIENMTGIVWNSADGLNETFTYSGAQGHTSFVTDDEQFTTGECLTTRIYGDTGAGVQTEFEEALLWDPANYVLVFTSILEDNILGFDNAYHDFEMIVLENGHSGDTQATTYYFWIELE